MEINLLVKGLVSSLVLSLVLLNTSHAIQTGDTKSYNFSGHFLLTGTDLPCDLDPKTTDLTVNFKSVIKKGLYLYTRTNSTPFIIRLTGCNSTLASQVTLTFKGTENSALPGLLAVTGSGKGIAIGLEKRDGTQLPFNQPTSGYSLTDGNNLFLFEAYVIGEPDAIKNQTITAGDFMAAATFEIAYP